MSSEMLILDFKSGGDVTFDPTKRAGTIECLAFEGGGGSCVGGVLDKQQATQLRDWLSVWIASNPGVEPQEGFGE